MALPKRSGVLLLAVVLPWIYVFFDLGQWLYLAYETEVSHNVAILNGRESVGKDSSCSRGPQRGSSFEALLQNSTSSHNVAILNGRESVGKDSSCSRGPQKGSSFEALLQNSTSSHNVAILNGRESVGKESSCSMGPQRGPSFEALLQNSTSGKRVHNYGFMYAQHFDKLWDKPVAFIEIGLREGDSLDLWKKFFRKAKVYGVDKGASDFQGFRKYAGKDENFQIFIGDQANVTFLKELSTIIRSEVGALDFVIDDGGHTMKQQITSFTHLMPLVKPGGVYFIEDLETSYYGPECSWFGCYGLCCGGGPPGHKGTTIALIKSLIDVMNEDFVKGPNTQGKWQIGHYSVNPADHLVGSIQCWRNMCAITKKKENSYF